MAKLKTDWILFMTIVAMVGFGIVILYSASGAVEKKGHLYPPYYFVLRQLAWAVVSFCLLMYFRHLDYRKLNSPAWAFSGLGVVLTLLIAVYFVDPQHRWFRIPSIGSLQPSEFARPALILFLAHFLDRRAKVVNKGRTLAQAAVSIAVLGFLVVASDLGTAMVPVITALIMFWVAGLERRYMVRVLATCMVLGLVAIASKGYRLGRVISYFDPDYKIISLVDKGGMIRGYVERSTAKQEKQTDGDLAVSSQSGDAVFAKPAANRKVVDSYQPTQSKIAIGSGGIIGLGLGEGKQFLFLPDVHTDFIYAAVGEQLGLIGAVAVLIGFLIILWRGARLFLLARGDFGKYLALGITISIVVQALLNISVALNMAPTKGFPLPLISFGGSSLLSTLVSLGMLLSVAEHEG